MKYFPNLVGTLDPDTVCVKELKQAGIKAVRLPEVLRRGEIKSVIMGEIGPWGFTRAWKYWRAEGPGISPDTAENLHEIHGKEVRVDGHCGCPSPKEWFKGFAVGHYHVDTQEGLSALAEVIQGVLDGE